MRLKTAILMKFKLQPPFLLIYLKMCQNASVHLSVLCTMTLSTTV